MQIQSINPVIVRQNTKQDNVTFKADPNWYLIWRVFNKGVGAIKNMEKASYVRQLSTSLLDMAKKIAHGTPDAEKCRILYAVIAKTPDSFFNQKNEASLSGLFYNTRKIFLS